MTDKFQLLYEKLLQELAQELKDTEKIYLEISQTVLTDLAGNTETVHNKKIQLLEDSYQQKISGLLADFGKIYPGHIEIFPVPEKAGLLQHMEIRNRQAEELENILNVLLTQYNLKNPFSHTTDKVIPPIHRVCCQCNCSMSMPEEENTLPAILVCGHHDAGRTSLIQAITQQDISDYSKDLNIEIYETPAAVFIDSSNIDWGGSDLHSYPEMIFDKSGDLTFSQIDTINCIWYCIDGSSMPTSAQDQDLLRQFPDNILLVITKCDLLQKEHISTLMKTLTEILDKDKIVMVSAEGGNGLCRLIHRTQKLCSKGIKRKNFRKDWKNYFRDKLNVWQDFMSDEADCYISWAEKRVAANADTLETETTALICKLAVIYGIAVSGRTITSLKKQAEKNSSAEKIINSVALAAKSRFESDTPLNKTVSQKRVVIKKQTYARHAKEK
ncbi:MAG: GTPase domain-containing protein [Lentisphaeria bacterium]|nr:GTPase domain-containing protein [Lentisphaeria bacterium]